MDVLSQQFKRRNAPPPLVDVFGEHDYPEETYPSKDPEGNPLTHRHTEPKPHGPEHLTGLQRMMVSEEGAHELNSFQDLLKGRV